jgi:hypothetical protein
MGYNDDHASLVGAVYESTSEWKGNNKFEEGARRLFDEHRGYRDWQRGCDFLLKAGMSRSGEVLVWKEHGIACQLSACWAPDHDEAWFLLSDLPAPPRLVSLYAYRISRRPCEEKL